MQWLGPALVTEEVRRLNLMTCLTDRLNIRERAACLALAMLGTDRGPSLTTPIGAGLAEEGARVVVALQASPGQLWMLLLLKINASSPPQFTHDGATSRRESNFFHTWYSFRDFFHTQCSFGGNQTSFTLGTLLGNRADDGLSDET